MAVPACVEVLAYREAHDKQGNQLCDNHRGEDLNADRFPETAFIDEHLGDYAEAGK